MHDMLQAIQECYVYVGILKGKIVKVIDQMPFREQKNKLIEFLALHVHNRLYSEYRRKYTGQKSLQKPKFQLNK